MKETNSNIKLNRFVSERKNFINSMITSFIDLKAAGIIGAISAVFKDHPFVSRINGGIVNRTACADPTPGPVTPFLQALVNYSYVSAHPYSGISDLIPAACNNKFSEAYTLGKAID